VKRSRALRAFLEWLWVWLGGDLAEVDSHVAAGSGQFVYVVQPGDTLISIAYRFSTSIWILADLNELEDHRQIHGGQRLLVPRPGASPSISRASSLPGPESAIAPEMGPFIYIARTGDTLEAVALRFGLAAEDVARANRIQTSQKVWPGQRMLIPAPAPEPGPESPAQVSEPRRESQNYGLEPIQLRMPALDSELSSFPSSEALAASRLPLLPGPDALKSERPPVDASTGAPTPELAELRGAEHPETMRVPRHSLLPGSWPEGAIRGIYVSYHSIGQPGQRQRIVDLLTKTEINALVIDVKGDQGLITYPTGVSLAHDIGAVRPAASDFDELMDFSKANGVYTIARIVTFRDHPFATAFPERAAQREAGGVWHDSAGLAWVDPFAQAAWEYNADLAEEAVQLGFNEVQFDDVRFPRASQDGAPRFSMPLSRPMRVAAVTAFLGYVRKRLLSLGVSVAASVLGYTCWRHDDGLVGQDIQRMATYLDVLCPVLFPTYFDGGLLGLDNAGDHPYEVIYESVKRTLQQVQPLGCRVRPWIQDFRGSRFGQREIGLAEVRAQVRASLNAGGAGYVACDPKARYTLEAYLEKPIDMSLSDDYN